MKKGNVTRRKALIPSMVAAACMLASSLAADAQRQVRPSQQRVIVSPVRVTPALTEGDPDLPIIAARASNTQIDPPSLQLDAGPASPPAPLTNAQKVTYLKGSGNDAGGNISGPDASLKTVTLTPKRPHVENQGYVGFYLAWFVDPEGSRASFYTPSGTLAPRLWVSVNVVQGNRYLVDFHLFSTPAQTFTVIHEGGEQTFNLQAGSKHLLLILEPKSSGYVKLTLKSGRAFTFYAAEISKL